MALIGSFGGIVFSASANRVNTLNNIKWNNSAQYAVHNRHLQDPILEFTGNAPDEFSFTMFFSAFLGVDPMSEIVKLLTVERAGEAHRLIIGTKAYGKYKWVITKTSIDLKNYDNKGNLLIAGVNVTLKAYGER